MIQYDVSQGLPRSMKHAPLDTKQPRTRRPCPGDVPAPHPFHAGQPTPVADSLQHLLTAVGGGWELRHRDSRSASRNLSTCQPNNPKGEGGGIDIPPPPHFFLSRSAVVRLPSSRPPVDAPKPPSPKAYHGCHTHTHTHMAKPRWRSGGRAGEHTGRGKATQCAATVPTYLPTYLPTHLPTYGALADVQRTHRPGSAS